MSKIPPIYRCRIAPKSNCVFTTKKFRNSTPIQIPEEGTATPYPSNICVSGFTDKIVKVVVSINNLSHTFVGDLIILLVAPDGRNATIMAGAGFGKVDDITLTFDDMGSSIIPLFLPLTTGTFQPSNYLGELVPLPPPAPTNQSFGSMLSTFNFSNPNGIWSLFVFDAFPDDSGNIAGGWDLTITTSNCTPQ
ncbi:hypothetical protein [Bacillus sp. SM2101]|uniref:hypothetical protein n=1 Tax=Bacillus sp. SM2101 TaxID=2805366 RepID=UPI001BDE9204|nr:hypothetical protein [Bacillus sp. SM2101]